MGRMSNSLRRYCCCIPFRWVICALLFFATTINYVDRQILAILAPTLQAVIGWDELRYGYIVTSFQGAYALGLLFSGWLIDRIGTRMGLMLAVLGWSVAAMVHGLATTVFQFALARFALGAAEAGNFPASIKTVSEWFPKRERAFAIGVFNSGSNIGAIITPLLVPFVVAGWGWEMAFFVAGAIGFMWFAVAALLFHSPEQSPYISTSERVHIESEREWVSSRVSWRGIVGDRRTIAFALAKFMTDPIWWFYLYWAPKYLSGQFSIQLAGLAAPLVAIYLLADVGSIGGGWISAYLIRSGIGPLRARQRAMLLCAIVALSVIGVANATNLWMAVLLLGLAAAAHQGWSANLFATVPDLFPKEAVASVVGIGGMLGAVGGMIVATATGVVLQYTGSYVALFSSCASAYLLAWLVFRYLVGAEPARAETQRSL
jgi:ACS family hexuronate transporter-like MFS transporter